MTQTRSLLLVAWLVVAYFVWDAWQKQFNVAPAAVEPTVSTNVDPTIPSSAVPSDGDVPVAPNDDTPAEVPAVGSEPAAPAPASIALSNDVLALSLDARGGTILTADLLLYPETTEKTSLPVQLMSQDPARFFVAQSGWARAQRPAPSHQDFRAVDGSAALEAGRDTVETHFEWSAPDGVSVRRTYRLQRGSYVLEIEDAIRNESAIAWRGNAYRQLLRVPPPSKGSGITNPEAYSFVGAAWYSPTAKFDKLKFEDFAEEPLKLDASGGWVAMLQHYFVAAWVPSTEEVSSFSTGVDRGRFLIRAFGPAIDVAPGEQTTNSARLYIGPKLQDRLDSIAPDLGLTLDYGYFTIISEPLHALLAMLHSLTGNWGWAIVLLVVMIKLALFKLSEAQYKSFAKMRRVQPRIEQLKERYGDDRQKFQQAMMELYKKEKINPMGGCLPILVQIPIFLALYWVLLESVELRQAPWIGWIQNLTAPDPYFVLPALNLLTMWLTQKLSPTPGMDPLQKKMMQIMPLVFGVMFAFFPAGLVLYWTTNGALGLLQQWIITRRHGEPAVKN
jgi:YidC/Oxa1 family membrane protein insertase